MREKRIVLENEAQTAFIGRNVCDINTIHEDLTAGRCFEARDHAKGRRFAAAGWSQEGQKFTGVDLQIDVVNRHEFFVVFDVAARNIFQC